MSIKFLLLLLMFFSHLIADYNLQGILADLKQRSWWNLKFSRAFVQDHYPIDYITALIEHSFMWSTCIMIPLLVYSLFVPYNPHAIVYFCSAILTNTGFHAIIDHQKRTKVLSLLPPTSSSIPAKSFLPGCSSFCSIKK